MSNDVKQMPTLIKFFYNPTQTDTFSPQKASKSCTILKVFERFYPTDSFTLLSPFAFLYFLSMLFYRFYALSLLFSVTFFLYPTHSKQYRSFKYDPGTILYSEHYGFKYRMPP